MTRTAAVRLTFAVLACLAVCLSLPACAGGSKLIKVKGKLTYKQKVLDVGNGGVTIILAPVVEPGQPYDTYSATYQKEDGTFEVRGRTGQGIPAGKYKITIQQMMMSAPDLVTQMNQRFGPNSPLVREVTDEQPLNIDLAEYMKP